MIFHSPPIVLGSFRAGSSAVVRYQCGHLVSVLRTSPRGSRQLMGCTLPQLRAYHLQVHRFA